MAAVWMRLRAELRSRWRAWLSLVLLFGVAAGVAIAAGAGARRTSTAYPRFLRAQDSFHAVTGGGSEEGYEEHYAALKAHPMIERFVEIRTVGGHMTIPAARGRPAYNLSIPEVFLAADPSGRTLFEVNRAKVLHGRLPDRAAIDETMVPFSFAERYGIELGDPIIAGIGFDPERESAPLLPVSLRVVGIVASPGDFLAVGQPSLFFIYTTPALFERYRDLVPDGPDSSSLGVHLRGGPSVATAFKQDVERRLNIDVPLLEPVTSSGVQKSMRLYAVALWILAALLGVGIVTILGQALARQAILDSAELPAMHALGATPAQFLGLGVIRAGLIGSATAAVAGIVAFLLSPLFPTGIARIAETDPGYQFDATALIIGGAATLMLFVLLSAYPSRRAIRTARAASDPVAGAFGRTSRIVAVASNASGTPAVAVGLRMALEPGRGRTFVPVRSTILAVAVGVAAVTASLVVGRSLTHLIETPALIGFTYDAIVPNESGEPDAEMAARLRSHPFVEQTVEGTGLNVVFGGVDSFIVALEEGGPIGFATIEGRPPGDGRPGELPEIALGPATMRRLGLSLGEAVDFIFASEDASDAGTQHSQQARVVGVAAVPPLPWAAVEPGEGAMMTVGAIRGFTPEEGGCCFVQFKEGTDLAAARAELEAAGLQTLLRTERADLATLERITRLPIFLSAIFGVLAGGALAHVLVTGIRRRRRDLAILKTLGFVNRQVRAAVAWQATAIAAVAVAVGIPSGIVLGRWGWRLVASQFGVVPVSIAPALWLLFLFPVGVLLANLVAAVPGRIAARTMPAFTLRTE